MIINPGEIRLCVAMRRANEAIIKERHAITTVDEVLQDIAQLNAKQCVLKIKLEWGHHQLELMEESRGIATFTTHTGFYRYKRLMFGITFALEVS